MNAIEIDPYILDVLMADLTGHDRKSSAFLLYLALYHLSWGSAGQGRAVALSYRDLAARTGLSRRAVQDAAAHLRRRGLLLIQADGPTAIPRYTPLMPWRR